MVAERTGQIENMWKVRVARYPIAPKDVGIMFTKWRATFWAWPLHCWSIVDDGRSNSFRLSLVTGGGRRNPALMANGVRTLFLLCFFAARFVPSRTLLFPSLHAFFASFPFVECEAGNGEQVEWRRGKRWRRRWGHGC